MDWIKFLKSELEWRLPVWPEAKPATRIPGRPPASRYPLLFQCCPTISPVFPSLCCPIPASNLSRDHLLNQSPLWLPELKVGHLPVDPHSLSAPPPYPKSTAPPCLSLSQPKLRQRCPAGPKTTQAARSPAPNSDEAPLNNHRPHQPEDKRRNRN